MSKTQNIFEEIYKKKLWGGRALFWKHFYSGSGSAEEEVIRPYLAAVSAFISGKQVVDIGCGDFEVGRRLFKLAERYVACDIARPLISYNQKRFRSGNLEFRVLDAVEEPLPEGEVVLVRQVLQHLDNQSVAKVLEKLNGYPTVIVTEHVPQFEFTPNIDMPTGRANRPAYCNSGLVITEEPFNFRPDSSQIICEVWRDGGIIRTHLHRFLSGSPRQ